MSSREFTLWDQSILLIFYIVQDLVSCLRMVTEIFWWKSELEWEERDNRIALWIWEFENFVMSLIANKTSCSDLKQTSKPSSNLNDSVKIEILHRLGVHGGRRQETIRGGQNFWAFPDIIDKDCDSFT